MSRPKANAAGPSAKKRIEDAFWSLLEITPYSEITIKLLAARANVNHKTIYYYYNNIDDLARCLFEENICSNFLHKNPLLAVLSGQAEDFLTRQLSEPGAKRAILYSRSDSPFLNSIFKQHIYKNWLSSVGITESDLSEDDKVDLEFIFSGMISLLGKDFSQDNVARFLRIFDRDLGQAIQTTFLKLTKSK